MAEETPKKLLRIRTFAQDVERARQKNGIVSPTETPKAEAPKLATAKSADIADEVRAEIAKVEETKKESVESTHIPAFHELQKKTSVSQTLKGPNISAVTPTKKETPAPKRTVSVRAKKQDLKTPKHVGGGTIITDSKKGDFNLIQSIIKSIDTWILDIKKSFKKKAEPKYVITDTERRRGVIQKATSKTGSIFTADNETLREEIRRRQQEKIRNEDDADITWTPNTETGYNLLESGQPKTIISNVSVSFKKQTTPTPVPTEVLPSVKPTEVPPPVAPTPKAPVEVPPPVIVEPTTTIEVVPAPAPEPIVTSPIIEETPAPTPLETPAPEPDEYELTTPEEHYKIKGLGDITRINTNILSVGIVSAIAGLVIFIVIVNALIGFFMSSSEVAQLAPATPLAETTIVADLALTSLIASEVSLSVDDTNYTTPTELRFIDEKGTPVAVEATLALIGFGKQPNLDSTITDVHVIASNIERAVIFTVTDSTTAFGSLLAWEKSLPADISDTLSLTTVTGGTFSDSRLGNTDVRIYTENGTQSLTYGFIKPNTIVIASSPAFFLTILGNN